MKFRYKDKTPDLFAVLIIAFICLMFFGRLFFPKPSLFYTVETLGSDLWSMYYPTKDFLSQSLKAGRLPLWSFDMGGGFPVFAEGQAGTFYLPNFIFYYLFPTYFAWNLNYLLSFFLLSTGTYFLMRRFKLDTVPSLFASLSFSLGGYFVSRMVHTSPFNAMAIFPWVFIYADRIWERKKASDVIIFAFILSQQIFTGHMQWVFITLFGFGVYKLTTVVFGGEKINPKNILMLLAGVILAVGISAIQIIPTYEFLQQSVRSEGIEKSEVFASDYPFKNYISLFDVNYFGSNKNGVRKVVSGSGLDWEVQDYLGIIPLVFLILFFVFRKFNKNDIGILSVLVFFVLLVPSSSPLSLLNTLPALNFFRIPSRYLLLTAFSICYFAGRGMEKSMAYASRLKKNFPFRYFAFGLIFLSLLDSLRFGLGYHSLVKVEDAVKTPEVTENIPTGSKTFVPIENFIEWKRIYSKNGYGDTSSYLYYKNLLYPSLGAIWGYQSLLPSAGFKLKRQLDYPDVNPLVLDIYSTKYIVSQTEPNDTSLKKVKAVTPPNDELKEIVVYDNTDALPAVRVYKDYQILDSTDKVKEILTNGNFDKEKVILESDPKVKFTTEELNISDSKETGIKSNETKGIDLVRQDDGKIEVAADVTYGGILVISDSYYPGWKAWVNGHKTDVMPANLNQKAVIIPAGKSTVVLNFEPSSLKLGEIISLITLVILFFWMIVGFLRRSNKIIR